MSIVERLQTIEDRAAAATPGKWEHWWCGDDHCDCHSVNIPESPSGLDNYHLQKLKCNKPGLFASDTQTQLWTGSDGEGGWSQASGNAAFIAASRTDVPALCKALRRAVDWLNNDGVSSVIREEALTDIESILGGETG